MKAPFFCAALLFLANSTGTIQSSAAELLFSDDFERASLGAEWTVVDDRQVTAGPSDWRVEDGALYQTSNIYLNSVYGGTHLVAGSLGWSDCAVTAAVTPTDNDGWGVIVRYQDSGNFYRFFTVRDSASGGPFMRFERFVNGTPTTLAESGEGFNEDQRYVVCVEATGNRLTAWLDGKSVLTATDATFQKGKIGFTTYACSVEVDHVRVRSGANTPATVQLTSPSAGAVFFAPANVALRAEANDPDGGIGRVEFFLGTTKLGEDTTTPHSGMATNLAAGTYTLTVKAYDSNGDAATSAPLALQVSSTDMAPPITGQWDFEQGDLRATVGNDLDYFGMTVRTGTRFGSTRDFGISDINGQLAKVMKVPFLDPMGGYVMRHGASANGGGEYVNQYTLILDLFYPMAVAGEWKALLQTEADNNDDGDFFINSSGGIGISGYHGKVGFGEWHRIALAVDLSTRIVAKFIDGVKAGEQTLSSGVDGRWALWPADGDPNHALLFADNNGENCEFYVNSVQFRAGRVSDSAVAALGGPSSIGIPYPSVPAPVADVLFSDSFERADLGPDWTVVDDPGTTAGPSAWLVTDGVLVQTSNIHGGAQLVGTHIVAGRSDWTDYSVRSTIIPTDDDGWGVMLRYQDGGNYYRFFTVWDGANGGPFVRLEKYVNGTATTLAELIGTAFAENSTNDVRVTAVGDKLTVSVNGQSLLSGQDGTFRQGKVGFGTYACSIEVEEVTVFREASTEPSSNQPPTVTLVNPVNGATFTAPATMTLEADARDADGSVSKVEFFSGNNKLGEDMTAPHQFTWSNVPAGGYALTARATDNLGASTASTEVSVQVNGSVNIIAPQILVQPRSLTITNGDMAVLNVAASGTAPLSFQWQKDGKDLTGATNVSLLFSPAQLSDQGRYTVVVRNAAGTATSDARELTVLPRREFEPPRRPYLELTRTGEGMRLNYWLQNTQGFFNVLQSDRLDTLAASQNILLTGANSAARRGDWTFPAGQALPVEFFQLRESANTSLSAAVPFFTQTVHPSPAAQTIDCTRGVRVQIPGGALPEPRTLKVSELPANPALPTPPGFQVGRIYEISAGAALWLDQPLTITIPYDPSGLRLGLRPSDAVTAAVWNPHQAIWEALPSTVDSVNHTLTFSTHHLSVYGDISQRENLNPYVGETKDSKEGHFKVVYWPKLYPYAQLSMEPAQQQQQTMEAFAGKILELAESSYRQYNADGFLPATAPVWIYTGGSFSSPEWSIRTGNIFIPTSQETWQTLKIEVAHELFHAVQNEYYNVLTAMVQRWWWTDACADYAARALAAGIRPPFLEYLKSDYFSLPLESGNESHAYATANFLAYMFDRTTNSVNFLQHFGALAKSDASARLTETLDRHIRERTGNYWNLYSLYFNFALECFLTESGYLGSIKPADESFFWSDKKAHTFVFPGAYTAGCKSYLISQDTARRSIRHLRIGMTESPDDSFTVSVFITRFPSARFPGTVTPRFPDNETLQSYRGIYTKTVRRSKSLDFELAVPESQFLTLVAVQSAQDEPTRCTVVVEEVPTFLTVTPGFVEAAVGQGVKLNAAIQGLSNQEVQWTVKEGPSAGSVQPGVSSPTTFTPTGLGVFHVIATSVADPLLSGEAIVSVPWTVTISHRNVDSRTVEWLATAPGGVEPLTFEWYYGFAESKKATGNPVSLPALDSIPYKVVVVVTDAKGNKGRATWE